MTDLEISRFLKLKLLKYKYLTVKIHTLKISRSFHQPVLFELLTYVPAIRKRLFRGQK